MTLEEERYRAKTYLLGLFPESSSVEFLQLSADMIVSMMVREEYGKSDIIWDQGADSTSLKIVVSGELLSLIDESGASELVKIGSIVGELGLVHGTNRLTTLACSSPTAVVYSLDIVQWRNLQADYPKVASLVDAIVIRYLAHRVQHVSNRYFHTTLPV
jgi:CRP-like cAMP-binding protein